MLGLSREEPRNPCDEWYLAGHLVGAVHDYALTRGAGKAGGALRAARHQGNRAPRHTHTWLSTPEEMDELLGLPGTRIPDTPSTPGRNKVVWQPSERVRITYEQHPYHRILLFGTGNRTGTWTHLAIRISGIYLVILSLVSGLVFG
jgi:hypothetical protein